MPSLKRAATSPEKYTEQERSSFIQLLELALLSDDGYLSCQAAEVGVAMEGENQRQGRELWPVSA